MITILTINKNPLYDNFIQVINKHKAIELKGSVHCGNDTVSIAAELDPDVIIVDTQLIARRESAELLKQLKRNLPKVKIITLVNNSDPTYYFQLIESGCDSIIDEYSNLTEKIVDSILSVTQNAYFNVPFSFMGRLVDRLDELRQDNYDLFNKRLYENELYLSVKEAEVAYYLRRNLKNREIAEYLLITEGTVKVHISNIYRKINVKGRKNVIEYLNRIMSKNVTKRSAIVK
ncbi:response regulator transcription factor [Oceanobacillus massiliensis]|uniref:response regulator transcription factor n=1 Tax=Oceanobacillus massiliensis TaxID=1465765 RepID=UPI000288E46D|nr:response regulator transcription factor [Oceanobacillus massiliensis]